MAIEIKRLPRPGAQPAPIVVAVEKLWLDASRERLLPDGHKAAAFLFCIPGDEILVSEAERVGLMKGSRAMAEPEPQAEESAEPKAPAEAEQEPEVKQAEPAEDKQAEKPADKQKVVPAKKKTKKK